VADAGLYLPTNDVGNSLMYNAVREHSVDFWQKGSGTENRNGPKGALHFRYLTPFPAPEGCCAFSVPDPFSGVNRFVEQEGCTWEFLIKTELSTPEETS
jgi:hypothetical protein